MSSGGDLTINGVEMTLSQQLVSSGRAGRQQTRSSRAMWESSCVCVRACVCVCVCKCVRELWHGAQKRVRCVRPPIGSPAERALIRPRRPKGSGTALHKMCTSLSVGVWARTCVRVSEWVCVCVWHGQARGLNWQHLRFNLLGEKTLSQGKDISWIPNLRYNLT